MPLAVVVACYLTGLLVNNLSGSVLSVFGRPLSSIVDSVFPHIGQSQRLNTGSVNEAWTDVQNEYVLRGLTGTVGTQGAEKGIIDAIKGKYGDRFTNFLTSDEYRNLVQGLAGRRTGSIGIALEARCAGATPCAAGATPNLVVIEDVLRDQPAERAGLRNGDVLTAVDGKTLASLGGDANARLNAAVQIIRGPAGTSVTLTVQRGPAALSFTVRRADLNLPSVFSTRLGSTLYVQVTGFDQDTGSLARKKLSDGLSAGATSVVLDLRANPGGLVSEARALASQFLRTTTVHQNAVVVRRGRLTSTSAPQSAQKVEIDTIQSGGLALTPKLAVLVDGDTASAAEIVTAALHDYQRGSVLGEKTFGKGSVQEDFPLPDGSDLHLTVERWYGPSGETIDGSGITPDKTVALDSPDHRFRLDAEGPDAAVDTQLQAALAAVRP
jgi:carboxyl-terminal processing protease